MSKVDDYTVLIKTKGPNPLVPNKPGDLKFEAPDKANAFLIGREATAINDTSPDYPALLVANDAKHSLRISNLNTTTISFSPHDDIAWQEQANVWLLFECAMRCTRCGKRRPRTS